jgi:hypothetical protein
MPYPAVDYRLETMLKINQEALDHMEVRYPGIEKSIRNREEATLPVCSLCGSEDTAEVGAGLVGYAINVAAATTKFKLIPNDPKPGKYFCNSCNKFFD